MKWRHHKAMTNPLDELERLRAEREESRKQEALRLGGDKVLVEKSQSYRKAVIREHRAKEAKKVVSKNLSKVFSKKTVSKGSSFFKKLTLCLTKGLFQGVNQERAPG